MYIYGKNVAIETLRNHQPIRKAYIYKNFQDKNIILKLQERNIPIRFVDKFELDKLAKGNHQGIMLDIPDYKYINMWAGPPVLDGVCDVEEYVTGHLSQLLGKW